VNAPLAVIIAGVLGFSLGSLPFGLWWGRLFRRIDIREHGSKNLGATNVFRVLGPVHGIVVLILDIGKGALAVLLGRILAGTEAIAIVAGMLAVLGHMFSPFAGFRGGKGVATGLGVWLVLVPAATGVALLLFGLTLLVTRRVSAGSLIASLVLVPAVYFLAPAGARGIETAIAGITALFVWLRHRGNLVRLARGEEPALWGRSR
jgi:glycerol-3-phosphate acyltransferase PlsY